MRETEKGKIRGNSYPYGHRDPDEETRKLIREQEERMMESEVSVTDGGPMPSEKKESAPKNHVRDHKPDYSLIPMDLLGTYLVPVYEEGLIKYYRDSWRLNFPHSVMVAAARRHLSAFWEKGEDWDKDTPEGHIKHHLGGVIFCCLCILNAIDSGDTEKDDRFNKKIFTNKK